ncbi:MAG: DUF4440 domain-containing protein [Thermoplasmata archaeon]|nr:MAG: DUF4440 domain-containing protein [Thermoplasmata archaeon]
MKEVNVEAEKQIIARLGQVWWEAWNQKDIDAEMALIAEDIIVQPANMPQFIGKKDYREFMEEYYKTLVSTVGESTRIEVSSSRDMAFDIGTMKVILMGPEGTIEDEQKYFAVYQKIDGEWKCTALSSSSDNPPM